MRLSISLIKKKLLHISENQNKNKEIFSRYRSTKCFVLATIQSHVFFFMFATNALVGDSLCWNSLKFTSFPASHDPSLPDPAATLAPVLPRRPHSYIVVLQSKSRYTYLSLFSTISLFLSFIISPSHTVPKIYFISCRSITISFIDIPIMRHHIIGLNPQVDDVVKNHKSKSWCNNAI